MHLLYLVRHGHTELSDSGEIAGFTDVSLSDKGRQEVSRLAESMPNAAPESLYSSDLIRAVQSLELLLGTENAVQDPRLRELNFGEWEGITWDEVHQRDANYLKLWSDNWLELAPPSGESFNDLAERTHDWFRELSDSLKPTCTDSSVMVTAHGGSIRALLCSILKLPLQCAFKFSIDHAHVTVLQISNRGHHRCCFLNSKSLKG